MRKSNMGPRVRRGGRPESHVLGDRQSQTGWTLASRLSIFTIRAHEKLDEAVFAAYGWDPAISDEELLERLLKLNLERSAT